MHLTDQAAFETALDVLLQLTVRGQEIVSVEQRKAQPDESLVGEWQHKVDQWVALRAELDPRDRAAVAGVLDTDAALLRSLRQV